jgi:hypothetical protein
MHPPPVAREKTFPAPGPRAFMGALKTKPAVKSHEVRGRAGAAMCIMSFVFLLALCGCDSGNNGASPTQTIRSGKHRLTMKYAPSGPVTGGGGFDFESLIWENEDGDFWRERKVITQQQFEMGTDKRRWVNQLHSFNPKTGNAIIKVAEGDAPKNSGTVNYVYSWREWNLLTNAEVRLIRVCSNPFEEY